jgi:hypothetical protein
VRGDVVQEQGIAHAGRHARLVRAADRQELEPGRRSSRPRLQLAQRLAHGRAVDAELAGELDLRRQPGTLAQRRLRMRAPMAAATLR